MISKKSILTHNNLQVKGILSNSSSKAKLKKSHIGAVKIQDDNQQKGLLQNNLFTQMSSKSDKSQTQLDQAFYKQTPLSKKEVLMDDNYKGAFKSYLQGRCSQDQMMYVKNFPQLYNQIPSPKMHNLSRAMSNEQDQQNMEEQQQQQQQLQEDKKFVRNSITRQDTFNSIIKKQSFINRKSISQSQQRKSFAMLKDTIHNQAKVKRIKQSVDKSLGKLKSAIHSNIQHRKEVEKGKPDVGGGLLGNIGAQAQNANKNQVQDQSVQSKINQQKQKYVTKNFSNLSIVHEKREHNPQASLNILNGDQENYHILRPLYKKFFKENSDAYIDALKDPFDPQYRQLLQHSDNEFDKLIQNYINKKEIQKEEQKAKEKQKVSRLKSYIQGGISDFGLRKQASKKEQIFIKQLGDLDSYTSSHMINSLVKFDRRQEQEMPNQQTRSKGIYIVNRTNNNKNQKRKNNTIIKNKNRKIIDTKRGYEDEISMSQNNSMNNISSASNYQRKLESQKKRGYFVIKRNQSLNVLNKAQEQGLVRDSSDESSQASMTEGQLDKLYAESIHLQNKLSSNKEENLIKKLKQLIHLEDLKKDVYETNSYKLENRF